MEGVVAEAFIVEAVRTPVGKRNGGLSGVHPADLAAHTLRQVVERSGVDPAAVDDVVMGCVMQVGPQTMDIARTAWLSAGLPESVPGVTIDRQCGSSQQAVHFAAQGVLSGTQDLVIAAGVESMSVVPMGTSVRLPLEKGLPGPFGQGWKERYGDTEISQFRGAQLMCEKWGIKREALEEFSLESHQRAIVAIDEGRFAGQIAPIAGVENDEGPRRDTTREKMAGLAPLREGWEITAAVASQISDGAAAVLIASEAAVKAHNLTPMARIHALAVVGDDPVFMLTGPIPATGKALARAAVTRPPARRGGRAAIAARLVSRRGPSSVSTPPMGTISRSNRPSSIATTARLWLHSAKFSMSAREIPQRDAISSAARNWEISVSP